MIYRATARQIKLNNSVMPLVFGHYAWLQEWQGERVGVAGSGILVAPGIGLSAKHVSKAFEKLDDRIEAAQRRTSVIADQYATRPAVTQYATLLYQAPRVRMPAETDTPFWRALTDWPSPDTDITVLQVEPISPASRTAMATGMTFIDWQLLPPDRGAEVDVFGFPNAKITVDSEVHVQNIRLISQTVRVVEVFDVMQVHGFTSFPGFQVDRDLDYGFSGGPVFYKERLVGIFSGPNYVSTLWPLLIHQYPHRDDNLDVSLTSAGSVATPLAMRQFLDLFDAGTIHAIDFEGLAQRVHRMECAHAMKDSQIISPCDKSHVVLSR